MKRMFGFSADALVAVVVVVVVVVVPLCASAEPDAVTVSAA